MFINLEPVPVINQAPLLFGLRTKVVVLVVMFPPTLMVTDPLPDEPTITEFDSHA